MNKAVLLVDDNRVARMMLRSVIAEVRPHWITTEAGDGETALAIAKDRQFDIMLIDVGLPGMSGLELAEILRRRYPDAAMALVTANIQKPVRERADALGAGFIEKPLKADALLSFFASVEDDGA